MVDELDLLKATKDDADGLPPAVPYPADPRWNLLPVLRGADDEDFLKIWEIVQKHNAMIIGGYVRWTVSPCEEPAPANDIDVFMPSLDEVEYAKILVDFETIYDVHRDAPLSTYFWFPDNAGSLSVNVIRPRKDTNMISVGLPCEILDFFDFTVVRAWLRDLEYAVVDPEFYRDELDKQLHWRHINCPIAAIYRLIKYSKKGYFARMTQVASIFADWDTRDPTYRQNLQQALIKEDPTAEEIERLEKLLWVD